MYNDTVAVGAAVAPHPILIFLLSFPIACFTGALATDIVYVGTADMMWADFSAWLLAVGIVIGVFAAIGLVIHAVAHRRLWGMRPVWLSVVGSLAVLFLAFFDNLVHSRDAWTSIMPTGLALSAVTVIVMLAVLWLNGIALRGNSVIVQPQGVVR
jgi:uncharacterized membrane protein